MFLTIPAGVSNRHVHLSQGDLSVLFGEGYELKKMKDLKQAGEYAAEETVSVQGSKGKIDRVRVLGPLRAATQVELLISDGFTLGITPPVRDSGSREPSPTVTVIGPEGSVTLSTGVISAWRHVHLNAKDADAMGLKEGQYVSVRSKGDRAVVLENVKVRFGNFIPEVHIDIEEANAAGIKNDDLLEIISS